MIKTLTQPLPRNSAISSWRFALTASTILIVAAALGAGAAGSAETRNGVDFSSWLMGAEGMLEATQRFDANPKPILVYFYTDWCGYCRQFESELLTSKELQNYLDDEVLAVRINPEQGAGNSQIGRRYGVGGYPALFVHSAESKVVSRIERMEVVDGKPRLLSPTQFIEVIEKAGSR
jgi:thiol:disulfide interchange protein